MSKPIIRVEGLSKRYRIGRAREPYGSLRESIAGAACAPFRRIAGALRARSERRAGALGASDEQRAASSEQDQNGSPSSLATRHSPLASDHIWALKDVSFEVQPGEVVGIIGSNGAGKSTLLKILSRITDPTRGGVDLYGRVGSLLEVGTGFHPELTGRENIYLNGAILGMTRAEINRKFDEIVDFSGVEQFLDTPVKRFSSGMYLRLAFAVAANLEPEILVVDEVLAVGDAAFQKKSLGKLSQLSRAGRTVMFVSHHMRSIKTLCSRVLQIDCGHVVNDGPPDVVIGQYLKGVSIDIAAERVWITNPCRADNECGFRLERIRILNGNGVPASSHSSSDPITVEMQFSIESTHSALFVGFDLITSDGVVVFKSGHNDRAEHEWPQAKRGRNVFQCTIPRALLNGGLYWIAPKIGLHAMAWFLNGEAELSFSVLLQHSESPFWTMASNEKFNGVIAPCLKWHSKPTREVGATGCHQTV